MTSNNLIVAPSLSEAFMRVGLACPDIIDPGFHRYATNGNLRDKSGWLRVFDDNDGAVFGDWREGSDFTWQRTRTGPELSQQELAAIRERAAQARQEAQAQRDRDYTQAATKAVARWDNAAPAIDHDYLTTKQIKPHGIRVHDDRLLIPVHDAAGRVQSLQTIATDGGKQFMPGGKMSGGRFWLGSPDGADALIICEGFATAASIYESTGCPVAVAFNAGNLLQVAKSVRDQYPTVRLVIAGDDDTGSANNIGRAKALEAAKAVSGNAVFPETGGHGSDFNDMAVLSGGNEVKELFDTVLHTERFKLLNGDDLRALPALEWRIKGVLPARGLASIYGPSASGKSFLAFDMAAAIADGEEWFDYRVSHAPVVYVALEGEAGFANRAAAWERHTGTRLPADMAMILQPLTLAADVVELARVIPVGAVTIIDTLNRAAPTSDENSSKDMGEILEAAKQLQAITGGLVVLVHHTGKDSSKGLRGHSSLFAALDAAIEVVRNGGSRHWQVAKAKDGMDGEQHLFKLDIIKLGYDSDGDSITSCVIAADETGANIRAAQVPQGANQTLIYNALKAVLANVAANPTGSPKEVPHGKAAVELESELPTLAASLTCEASRKITRARETIAALAARGVVMFTDGWLWIK